MKNVIMFAVIVSFLVVILFEITRMNIRLQFVVDQCDEIGVMIVRQGRVGEAVK